MSLKKTWGVIGLGWLGKPLSEQLKNLGFDVLGTRSSDFNFLTDEFPKLFCNILFLNTPPLLNISPIDYVNKIPKVFNEQNAKVIFISSTSVFGEHQGLCTEETFPEPQTENGKWLLQVEHELEKKFKENLTIIRPGGLIGEDRHPVFAISKNNMISGGDNVINLIHKSDLINIIVAAEKNNFSGIINAVSPYHPKRSEYYNFWAKKLNLKPINFKSELTSTKKVESVALPLFYNNWIQKNLN